MIATSSHRVPTFATAVRLTPGQQTHRIATTKILETRERLHNHAVEDMRLIDPHLTKDHRADVASEEDKTPSQWAYTYNAANWVAN